ncbi:hypothetical protein ES708_00278 [subsurface metagenome]
MNTEEIRQKYLALHNALGSRKDAENKELFDRKHRQIWYDCDVELQQRKAELEAKSTLTDEERAELDEF